MKTKIDLIDTLICVGSKDIESLSLWSIKSCIKNFPFLGKIYIVTPDKPQIEDIIKKNNLSSKCYVLQDSEVLSCYVPNRRTKIKEKKYIDPAIFLDLAKNAKPINRNKVYESNAKNKSLELLFDFFCCCCKK